FHFTTSPVFQEVVQRPIDRNFRTPAELLDHAPWIANEERYIVRTIAIGIDADRDSDARSSQQPIEQLANRDRAARAVVVRPYGPTPLGEHHVRAHGVSNVGQVAASVEVADRQLGLAASGFD